VSRFLTVCRSEHRDNLWRLTCTRGSHPTSIADSELRAHGLDGLRVIDGSVMPAVTSTNTNAPTIMIGEKGAAMIRGTARQRLVTYEGGGVARPNPHHAG
jgi:choline dehydrogenase-like flavoprotein